MKEEKQCYLRLYLFNKVGIVHGILASIFQLRRQEIAAERARERENDFNTAIDWFCEFK